MNQFSKKRYSVSYEKKNYQVRGFTLIEMLISITILSIITGIGLVNLTNYKNRHSFDLDSKNILEAIRNAENKSILGDEGAGWGIRFTSNTNNGYFEVFSGTSYATSSIITTQYLSKASLFSDPPPGFSKTIVFGQTSGMPDASQMVTLKTITGSDATVVSLSKGGALNQLPGKDLIGYWPLDEELGSTAYDASGKGNNGIVISNPVWQTESSCRTGGCLNFDGSSNYVISGGNLGISGDASFTLCSWIKWTGSLWSTGYPSFMGNNSTGTTGSGLSFTIKDGRPAIDFWNNRFRANDALSVNTWYYLCGTKSSGIISTNTQLYVNGSLVPGSVEGSDVAPNITNSPAIIGRLDGTRWFQGLIDDVRIYSRALASSEIETLYESY